MESRLNRERDKERNWCRKPREDVLEGSEKEEKLLFLLVSELEVFQFNGRAFR